MNVLSPKRVMILIDGANLLYGLRAKSGRERMYVDRNELVQAIFRVLVQERPVPFPTWPKELAGKPVEFVTVPVNYHQVSDPQVQKQAKFVLRLEQVGFEVVQCPVDFRGLPVSGYEQFDKDFRPESPDIAGLLTQRALDDIESYDIAVVVSGENGLLPLYAKLQEQEKHVVVFAFMGYCSEAVKTCKDINELFYIEELRYVVKTSIEKGGSGERSKLAAG
ncbi:MAG TPA: NYN domain-containing protein [Candidatus Binatia bacterium]|nr:NYN domain-containing protein [Candidatus Binatia bacterium]